MTRSRGVSSGILRLPDRRRAVGLVYLLAATALGSLLFVRLAAARYFTAAHQLRRYLR